MSDRRIFQVRNFEGLYSVVFNMDLKTGHELYEHREHIDLKYEKAKSIALEYEKEYGDKIKEISQEGNWGSLPINMDEWQKIS